MTAKTVDQKIKAITQKIVKEYQPEKIILFGSYAWGKPHKWSDVDLLVVKKTSKSRLDREQELRTLLSPQKIAIDVLVYTPSELEKSINQNRNLFIEDIVHNGRALFTKRDYAIQILRKPAKLIV